MLTSYQDICDLEKTPLSEQPVKDNIYLALQNNAREHPDKTAIYYFESYGGDNVANDSKSTKYNELDISYRELHESVNVLANLLFSENQNIPRQQDVNEIPVISILAANHPDTASALLAAPTFGCVCPINYLLEAKAVAGIIDAANSSILIATGSHPALDIAQKLPEIAAHAEKLKTIVIFGELSSDIEQDLLAKGIRLVFANQSKGKYSKDKLDFPLNRDLDRPYAMFHTGGTTGTPKLVMQTQRNQLASVWIIREIFSARSSDFTMTGLPLFHVNAAVGSLISNIVNGSSLLLAGLNGYRSPGVLEYFFEYVARFRITSFSAVPTIYAALMQIPTDHLDLSCLRYAICGAAPMPVELFKAFEQKTGLRVIEGYGLTEATAGCCLNLPDGEPRVGSIGHRFPYVELMIAEIDQDNKFVRQCKSDEVGIILLRGPVVTLGYKQQERNKELWVEDPQGNRWLNTGDLARIDNDHYIWLAGRKKELIIRGGHNIDPKDIEEVLARHPAVLLAAAVGRPDRHAGEIPVAYVATNNSAGITVSEEELLDYCQQHIGERAAIPKAITVDNKLPVTAVGKIFKPELIKREITIVVHKELQSLDLALEADKISVFDDKNNGPTASIDLSPYNLSATRIEAIAKQLSAYAFATQLVS